MDAAALSIQGRLGPIAEAPDQGSLALTAWLDGGQFALSQTDGRWRGALLWRYVQRSRTGAFLDDVQDEMNLNLSEEQYRQVLKGGLLWRRRVRPTAHADNVRVLVRDQNSGMLGTLTLPLADSGGSAAPVTVVQ